MSALQFQKAMAHLIRFPSQSWEETLRVFQNDLSLRERETLEKMSLDPLVRKFGYKMRYLRLRDARNVMRLTTDFIDPDLLQQLYIEYFEPSRTGADLFTIGIKFLEFCLTDSRCLRALESCDPFLKDVIRYEATRAGVEREVIQHGDPTLPEGSKLSHRAFRIIDLGYDVPAIDRLKVKDPTSRVAPKPKAIKLLILRSEAGPYYRMYEIDQAIEAFLKAQLENPQSDGDSLPPAYLAMVACGLCRSLEGA